MLACRLEMRLMGLGRGWVRGAWGAGSLLGLTCWMIAGATAQEQGGRRYTNEDYARAEKMMAYNLAPLVYHGVQRPVWVDGSRFWYRDRGPEGFTTMLVDAGKGSPAPAFDHAAVAAAVIAAKPGTKADEHYLRVTEIAFDGNQRRRSRFQQEGRPSAARLRARRCAGWMRRMVQSGAKR